MNPLAPPFYPEDFYRSTSYRIPPHPPLCRNCDRFRRLRAAITAYSWEQLFAVLLFATVALLSLTFAVRFFCLAWEGFAILHAALANWMYAKAGLHAGIGFPLAKFQAWCGAPEVGEGCVWLVKGTEEKVAEALWGAEWKEKVIFKVA